MTNAISSNPEKKRLWLYDILLIGILFVGAYFRLSGINWGELQYQHPDELFLTSVTYDIQPVHSLAEYFNTATSTLNPHNTGHGYFVYGTLPVFIVRGLADLTHQLGNLQLFGRYLSALADLATVTLLYFMVKRLYGPRVGILAAMFSALVVMQIQQSHFYTTDNFATFFMLLATYFVVEISVGKNRAPEAEAGQEASEAHSFSSHFGAYFSRLFANPLFWLSVGFGLALGMAVASKLNAALLAILLPGALAVRYFGRKEEVRNLNNSPSAVARSSFEGFIAKMFVFMVVGALFSILAFRVFQPYAFYGLGLNPKWLANIREQRADASPDSGLIWNLQWARRTHLYSFQNLTVWGLGLPLGMLAWAGFLWMGWRMLKGEWRQHILLWGWTAIYFLWQSFQFNPNMRYQLPVYPLLAMMAAWAVFDWAHPRLSGLKRLNWRAILAATVGVVVLVLTLGWAYAFSRIYIRPETRVAASRWIYQNVPGPINLQIQTTDGTSYQQPLPFQAGSVIQANAPYQLAFTTQVDGVLNQILLPHVTNHILRVTILQNLSDPQQVASGFLLVSPAIDGATKSASQILLFNQLPALDAQQNYVINVEVLDPAFQLDLCGPLLLSVAASNSPVEQTIDPSPQCIVSSGQPYQIQFTPQTNGTLTHITFSRVADVSASGSQTLHLVLSSGQDFSSDQVLASASAMADFVPAHDPRGNPFNLVLDHPATLKSGVTYYLRFDTTGAALTLIGSAIANETDYDWNLPFRLDGYDGFNGIYRGDLNLQVYWEDNANKLARYESFLDQTDYIFIPTAHQYMQTTRLPERYPLTSAYYRQLLGCPVDKNIIWCYRVAKPGVFKGNLGFDLVATFESYPTLGPLVINDQNSEESFTFYDHPKVLIFRKSPEYNPAQVQALLGSVDLSNVIQLTPGQANRYKDLMLPADQLAAQQAGGTWSQLFDWNAFQNKYPGLGVVLWYLVMFLVGLFAYPIVRTALPGLPDHGYPLARTAGLAIWAWFSWIAGSLGVSYSRLTIGIALGLLALIGALLAYRQRHELRQEWRTKKKYFLAVEGLFLAFFLLDLLIRFGNPDIWHDPNGGERPMEFAYFNAILKSTTFPPYDPWFAGGYINYYYYGYVIIGTPVKLLGIVPSVAYNLILPTLFACLAVGGFSVLWNLMAGEQPDEKLTWKSFFGQKAFIAGLSGATALVLLGNLAIVRLFYRSFMCAAAPASQLGGISIHDCIITPGSSVDKANILARLWWTLKGLFLTLGGQSLDYTVTSARELYWGATRVLPAASGGPITEFPLASFLWSDLHAHLMALGVTVLAIAWVLSVVLAKAKWKSHLDTALAFILGGLVIGALKPVNTWDFYTYLLLASIVLAYVIWRYIDTDRIPLDLPKWVKRLSFAVGAVALLAGLSLLFYHPFTQWYGQAYNSFEAWKGDRSDISSYLVHWGVFLFFIVSWMVWETREWMAVTPVSSLRKLKPYQDLIIGGLVFLLLLLVLQQIWVIRSTPQPSWKGVTILWLALPLAAWAGVLILRPGLPDTKRLVLFMVGTALVITMFVEIFVVRGDIGRQNTVFKFYMQAWVLLGVSAVAAFNWMLGEYHRWLPGWRTVWNMIASILVVCSALFLLIYGMAKVHDRMSPAAPHTLDGMTYMAYTTYSEFNVDMDLSEDYRAIRWMQENVQGSPVIAEAPSAGIQYTWLNRFSIYTGLPDVVGWEWHQIQQRLIFADTVRARGLEEDAFYATSDINTARDFLRKYNVRYIIVGQLERAKYAGDGLSKFEVYKGILWDEVYRDGQTVIYEVPAGSR
jgi:YYY domain-containing protein